MESLAPYVDVGFEASQKPQTSTMTLTKALLPQRMGSAQPQRLILLIPEVQVWEFWVLARVLDAIIMPLGKEARQVLASPQ